MSGQALPCCSLAGLGRGILGCAGSCVPVRQTYLAPATPIGVGMTGLLLTQEARMSQTHAVYPTAPLYSQFRYDASIPSFQATTGYRAGQGLDTIIRLLCFDDEAREDAVCNEAGGQPLDQSSRTGLLCAALVLSEVISSIFTTAHQCDRQK